MTHKPKHVEGIFDVTYLHTAGHIGEKFLKGLQAGKIQGSMCESCGNIFVPARSFCEDCFIEVAEMIDVGPEGSVYTMTRHGEDYIGAILLDGATTVMIHRLLPGDMDPVIGDRVKAIFVAKKQRKGSITDLQGFKVTD